MKCFCCILATALLIAAVTTPKVGAEQKLTTSSALTVSPSLQFIHLANQQSTPNITISVTNTTKVQVVLDVILRDFTTLGRRGSLSFFNTNHPPQSSYGLSAWLQPNPTTLILPPASKRTLNVTIKNIPDLSPGGHYAAVLFSKRPNLAGSNQNTVTTREVVSSLLFVTTSGKIRQDLSLNNVVWGFFHIGLPEFMDLVFTNRGNSLSTPRGYATITNTFGHEVARGILNQGSGVILPATTRLFSVPLQPEPHINFPGIYRVRFTYQADGQANSKTYTKTFVVITKPVIAASIILSGALLFWAVLSSNRLKGLYKLGKRVK